MTPNYLPKNYDIFLGIDVDKNSYSFTVQDHNSMNKSQKIASEPEQLYKYVRNRFGRKRVLFAYEAGPTGYSLYDYLSSKEQDCIVVSPLSIPKAPNQRVKNNRIDSLRITEELKAGKLRSIRVPKDLYRELRHLINLREDYVYSRKAAKQRIKSLLLYAYMYPGLKDVKQNWSNGYIKILKEISCSDAVRQRLDMLLSDLDYARHQTKRVLTQLRVFVKNNKSVQQYMHYLTSISGVGFITAITILGRIGDPERLRNVRELSAFVGLVPREYSTGDTVRYGSITQLGNSLLRSLLVEAAWSAIRKDKELNQFFYRIKNRHHPSIGSRKAIVAVARKLTQRIYCVLKEQRVYSIN